MSNPQPNWCPEIYRGIFVDRFNDDTVRVAPCCQAQSELEPVDGFSFDTSPYLTKLRHEFDQGLRPSACDACWQAESAGHKSRRISAIEFYQLPEPSNQVLLENLDHSVTWACNLACVMCGPYSSSTWARELDLDRDRLITMGRHFQKHNRFIENIPLENLKKIHFNGGEPLLNQDQAKFVQRLSQRTDLSDLTISYNTNASVMPSHEVIEIWRRARTVKLFFSIDGINDCFDYVRWPAKWHQVQDNMLQMKQSLPDNVIFGFNTTVGAYNILEVADVVGWFQQNLSCNASGDPSDFNWQIARNFDPASLCIEAKTAALERANAVPGLESLANYIESTLSRPRIDAWIHELDKIDRRRQTNWKSCLAVSQYYQHT